MYTDSNSFAKLFQNGHSQAVRLPKAFRFEGTEVRIYREGKRVILEPVEDDPFAGWEAFFAGPVLKDALDIPPRKREENRPIPFDDESE